MTQRTTDRTVVEHFVETDERGNRRIGARRVDAGSLVDAADDLEEPTTVEDRPRLSR